MADPAARRVSPLSHRTPIQGEAGELRLAELPFLGKFVLRAEPREAADRIAAALGRSLPLEPLASAIADDTALLWLGPDEWLIVTPPGEAALRFGEVRDALAGMHHQLVEVSDYYTAIEVSGGRAREALMKLTTLDLHPRAFRAGTVAGGVFGRANAALWQAGDDAEAGGPTFRLFIRWSMADYLWCLLADAGREWGVPEQATVKGEALVVA